MLVKKLQLTNFRNLAPTVCEPDEGVNILWGDNAQGKTNLLEAVWLFTGSRSFRGAKDEEMVQFDSQKAELQLDFYAQERDQTAEITIQKKRSASLNRVKQTSAAKLAGHFCAVVFSPTHLNLVKGAPEGRRKLIDAAYCQLRPAFYQTLLSYNRVLAQRNALLKNWNTLGDDGQLELWDRRLAQIGSHVMQLRHKYVEKLDSTADAIYQGLSQGKEPLKLAYFSECMPEPPYTEEALLAVLQQQHAADKAAGFTTVGPHRDDLKIQISGLSARQFASQGQQRSAVIAMKLAEASLLRDVTGEQPVALLDDVMSELDEKRQDFILHHIHGWQVFLTCCDPTPVSRLAKGKSFHIQAGKITEIRTGGSN